MLNSRYGFSTARHLLLPCSRRTSRSRTGLSFIFILFRILRFFNSIHFNYNNSNNETISSSRNSAVASCVIVCQCSAVNARTNENISSSSLSASVPLSNILIGLSSTRSWTKKLHHWTPEKRQKRLRWVPGSNKCERIFSSHLYQHSTTKTKSYQAWQGQVCHWQFKIKLSI